MASRNVFDENRQATGTINGAQLLGYPRPFTTLGVPRVLCDACSAGNAWACPTWRGEAGAQQQHQQQPAGFGWGQRDKNNNWYAARL